MPFLGLTRHEVASAVLDKALLGGVAIGFGYWLNQRMEVFRSRRAAEAEFLRERTKRLDELFGLMLEVETASEAFVAHLGQYLDLVKETRAQSPTASTFRSPKIDTAYDEYREVTQRMVRQAARYTPWIGKDLYVLVAAFAKTVDASVDERSVAGSHDVDRIDLLQKHAFNLREAIMAEIRQGAPAPKMKKKGA